MVVAFVMACRWPIQADLEPLPGFCVLGRRLSGGVAALNPRLPSCAPPGQSFVNPTAVRACQPGWTKSDAHTNTVPSPNGTPRSNLRRWVVWTADPGRSGTPPGVLHAWAPAFRGCRCARPPATLLGPSGAVVREPDRRPCLPARLDEIRCSHERGAVPEWDASIESAEVGGLTPPMRAGLRPPPCDPCREGSPGGNLRVPSPSIESPLP